ncbi:FecR family protein [Telluribacter sp.]|jgi:ferric-dicitrate binding protein FerR (iron transport regulator)|uniref:FecR family protein n=1 Tax=Telluribacter sp. TaxID=1978767 RepID=UPI002E0D6240|nr:FecR domain-containing protein [Telluribacter sp.]
METSITKQLIFDHFARKTSPLQREMIEEWLRNEAHEEQYYEWLEEWESRYPQYVAQTEQALERFAAFLQTNPLVVEETKTEVPDSGEPTGRSFWRKWLLAASVGLFLLLGGWVLRDDLLYKNYQTAYGEVKTITLSDGSVIKLNTNSSLRVPRWGFGKNTREVYLTGEANFSIVHTADDQTFVVKTPKEFEVVVLGTEFTMYARQHNSKVVLKTGKVQVRYQEANKQKEVMMKPGDLVTLDRENRVELKTTQQAQKYSEWEEKRFVFEETTLEEVACLLQENYGLEVEIKDKELSERVLMGSFKANNMDELLLSISELLDINVVRQGNHVQLSDK